MHHVPDLEVTSVGCCHAPPASRKASLAEISCDARSALWTVLGPLDCAGPSVLHGTGMESDQLPPDPFLSLSPQAAGSLLAFQPSLRSDGGLRGCAWVEGFGKRSFKANEWMVRSLLPPTFKEAILIHAAIDVDVLASGQRQLCLWVLIGALEGVVAAGRPVGGGGW